MRASGDGGDGDNVDVQPPLSLLNNEYYIVMRSYELESSHLTAASYPEPLAWPKKYLLRVALSCLL